jgi:hypothetical protein
LHHFSHFFSLCALVGGAAISNDFVAPQAGSAAIGIHGMDSNALKMAF